MHSPDGPAFYHAKIDAAVWRQEEDYAQLKTLQSFLSPYDPFWAKAYDIYDKNT